MLTAVHEGKRTRLIALWSAPRSRSTAFERMFAERGDFTVLHEPFSHVADFGTAIVMGREVRDERALISALLGLDGQYFFKDTTDFAYPRVLRDRTFLTRVTHTFIIRRPSEIVASHAAMNPHVTRDEIGLERLAEIYHAVHDATGEAPVVVDSDDLIDYPAATVEAYCARVGVPFIAHALTWQAAEQPGWQRTGRWHRDASASTGFHRRVPDGRPDVDVSPELAEYCAYHQPYYDRLYQHRLRVDPSAPR